MERIITIGRKAISRTNLPLYSNTPQFSNYDAPTALLTNDSIAELNPKNIESPHKFIVIFPSPTPASIAEFFSVPIYIILITS